MLFQSVRAKLPYRSNMEADGFTWQAWGAELGYRSQAAATQWLHGDTYLRSGGEGGSKEKKYLHTTFMGWESQTGGLSFLSAETMGAIKEHELIYRAWVCMKWGWGYY